MSNCGCAGQALPSNTPCNDQGYCEKEPCSELFCQECIAQCQPEMSIDLGTGDIFTIKPGDRLDEILQKILIAMVDPTIADVAPIGLRLLNKTETTIVLRWKAIAGKSYTINYTDGITPLTVVAGSVDRFTLFNLASDTEYVISVTNTTDVCDSVNIKIKTI
jgi:hypothetical protein